MTKPPPSRAVNVARMQTWVAGVRGLAAEKPDPHAFLLEWHDWLGRQMSVLGGDACPRHLAGLTAFDLGEAQAALARPLATRVAEPA